MSRRVSLPAAEDLFRPTTVDPGASRGATAAPSVQSVPDPVDEQKAPRKPSGRIRHDEKMTVYVTADELHDIEQARLMLRRTHGLGVDRGRLVRSAIAMALADLEQNGADSLLVSRLRES